jgi:sigma-B regulation protein RsbU (phosphoserine phosphatase)
MDQVTVPPVLREQLLDRRERLEREIGRIGSQPDLARLLQEVDDALGRIAAGTYGLCETCHDSIEADRLLADPLVRVCLDHLTAAEQRALERDLQLAANIQRALLPAADVAVNGWQLAYHYRAASIVSGDYCDHIATGTGDCYFIVGDVSGKGVAASMLMAHLQSMFRALVPAALPLDALMERASRVFCESTLPTHYATLVCGHASADGTVEIANAGHPPPLLIRCSGIESFHATGLPLGMFCSERFGVSRLRLAAGDSLLLYTDGVLEARDAAGLDYGIDRLRAITERARHLSPRAMVDACVQDLAAFVAGERYADDVTVMAVRRAV